MSVVAVCAIAWFVVKKFLMSLVSVGVLHFLAFVIVKWLRSGWRFVCVVVVGMWLLLFSLVCVVSYCVSWVARVNGGVASGLGGALVLSGGCGSNIVPFLTYFAQRAEGVLGMLDLDLRWGWARSRFYT